MRSFPVVQPDKIRMATMALDRWTARVCETVEGARIKL